MPDFRLVSKSFIELSELEEKILLVAQKRNNEIKKNVDEGGVEFEIVNSKTGFLISFSIYDKNEFLNTFKFNNNEYGCIIQINWSSKMSHEDIDNFMIPFIKEFGYYFPNIMVEHGEDNFITIEDYVNLNEE
ncbi:MULTISPECIES: hypothetical protein [Chryseobacterium]|uniref:hypothetical protein n=1 Tax=Chryseobacterium TaxID=59732 RepID=UPI000493355F|nr:MULTISPECIES: hypothetical protein [Chryseobacterium]MDR6158695.1 hypothetical protein [Chryseobacterium sp. SLBN-27]